MMSWWGHKRADRSEEIAEIDARREQSVEVVKDKRIALEKVVEKMKRDRANDALGK
jgi:hypothetical protein